MWRWLWWVEFQDSPQDAHLLHACLCYPLSLNMVGPGKMMAPTPAQTGENSSRPKLTRGAIKKKKAPERHAPTGHALPANGGATRQGTPGRLWELRASSWESQQDIQDLCGPVNHLWVWERT